MNGGESRWKLALKRASRASAVVQIHILSFGENKLTRAQQVRLLMTKINERLRRYSRQITLLDVCHLSMPLLLQLSDTRRVLHSFRIGSEDLSRRRRGRNPSRLLLMIHLC